MARVLGLETLHMADTDVLPYDYVTYGKEIEAYLETPRRRNPPAPSTSPRRNCRRRFTKPPKQ